MKSLELFPEARQPLATAEFDRRISRIYDHLYANAPVRTPAGIAKEVGKLLHVALFVEEVRDVRPAFEFTRSQVRDLDTNATDLPKHVAKQVRRDFVSMVGKWRLYAKDDSIQLSDADIAFVCGQLSGVAFSNLDRDVFGDALEVFRSQWVKQNGGQYFTDQRVTRIAMTLLNFDPWGGDDLVDICSGTGGFLQAGLRHIQTSDPDKVSNVHREPRVVEVAVRSLRGREVDKDVCDVANAALVARLGDSHSLVSHGDSLSESAFSNNADAQIGFASHRCAASNPPFGTKITIKDHRILKDFELAKVYRRRSDGVLCATDKITSRAPDILFLEQNIRLLEPARGRLAIVTPYQILSGPQTLYIRDWLLRNAEVIAVIDLPAETFQPHTGTKTCLLVVRRRKEALDRVDLSADGPIFMAMPQWIGHDRRGNPVYKRRQDGSETGDILHDFDQVEAAYAAFEAGGNPQSHHPNAFSVRPSRIFEDPDLRLNARFHRPNHAHELPNAINPSGPQTSSWKVVKISEVVDRIFFPGRFKRNYVDGSEPAVPFLGGANICQLLVNTEKFLRTDDPRLPDLRVRTGWVIVTRSGSTGIVAMVPPAWDGFAMSEHVIRIVPKPARVAGEYIFAYLRTEFAQRALSRGVFGSVIDEITPEFIGDIEMPVPESKRSLNRIIRIVREGEDARQTAIDKLQKGVEKLEGMIADSLTATVSRVSP